MRSLHVTLPVLAALALASGSGCGIVGTSFDRNAAPAGVARVLGALAGAFDELADEAPDEVFRILRPPKAIEPLAEETAPGAAPTGRFKIGLRGGMLTSGGADVKWTDTAHYGLYLRRVPFESARMTYELAADFARTERPDGYRTSNLYTLRGSLLLGRAGGKGVSVCFLAGGAAVIEDSTNTVSGKTALGVGGGVEAGVSVGSAGGAWDLRLVYTQIIATANASSFVSVSFGFTF